MLVRTTPAFPALSAPVPRREGLMFGKSRVWACLEFVLIPIPTHLAVSYEFARTHASLAIDQVKLLSGHGIVRLT